MRNILSCFNVKKPIIGVIHTKGTSDEDVLQRAKTEIELYVDNGVDGVLVETYFGTYYQVQKVLEYLKNEKQEIPYGVNCLNVDAMGFELANQYGCSFLQIDSVVGHVKPRDEDSLDAFFKLYRAKCDAFLLGGVRFKYQPVLSNNSVDEDLKIAMGRCDAVCVTEDATGQETSLSKIVEFRNSLGEFPLFVCAGVTPDNVEEQLKYADGAVVGSYFKDNYTDNGDVCAEHIVEMMNAVKRVRKTL